MALAGAFGGQDRIIQGQVALSSGTASVVVPGLYPGESIKRAFVGINKGTAPGVSTSCITWTFTALTLSIFGWMPTSAANPTLLQTTGTDNVDYIIVVGP